MNCASVFGPSSFSACKSGTDSNLSAVRQSKGNGCIFFLGIYFHSQCVKVSNPLPAVTNWSTPYSVQLTEKIRISEKSRDTEGCVEV